MEIGVRGESGETDLAGADILRERRRCVVDEGKDVSLAEVEDEDLLDVRLLVVCQP